MAAIVQVTEISLTENIRHWIRTVLLNADLPNETREELRKYTSHRRTLDEKKPRTIPFELVKSVHEQTVQNGFYLHELLQGSEVQLPEVQVLPRNPQLEARIQRLKDEQEEKEYDKMTRNVTTKPPNKKASDTVGGQMRIMNNQLLSVFNVLVTVLGSFAFAYKATEYSMATPNFAVQLLSGLIVATVVFIADLYFLLKYYG